MLMFIVTGWAEGSFLPTVFCYAAFYGGFGQFVAGILELIKGNTFAGTAFSSYGCFCESLKGINISCVVCQRHGQGHVENESLMNVSVSLAPACIITHLSLLLCALPSAGPSYVSGMGWMLLKYLGTSSPSTYVLAVTGETLWCGLWAVLTAGFFVVTLRKVILCCLQV